MIPNKVLAKDEKNMVVSRKDLHDKWLLGCFTIIMVEIFEVLPCHFFHCIILLYKIYPDESD